jgi:tetratricopeptide (TPR) repeat protein
MDIEQILKKWKTFDQTAFDDVGEDLKVLALNECWQAYFEVYEYCEPKLGKELSVELTANCLKHLVVDLENQAQAASYLSKIILTRHLTFNEVAHDLIRRATEIDDAASEASILETVIHSFTSTEDKELALERLCMLYEKKLYLENKLKQANEMLLKINPQNIQGLRYLKNSALLHQRWNDLVPILERLLLALKHPEEKLRAALDLAAIHLYQLGSPKQCLVVLDQYGSGRIDTSKMRFHAYEALRDWDSCIGILNSSLEKNLDDEEKSAIHYYLGKVFDQKGDLREAYINFLKSSSLSPDNLVAAEEGFKIAVHIGDLGEIMGLLNHVIEKKHWKKEFLVRANDLVERLKNIKSVHAN